MTEKYELTMKKSDQILGFSLFLRDWTIKEIATELNRKPTLISQWSKRYDWRMRKKYELHSIEDEIRDKTLRAREKIIQIGTQTLDDVFIRDGEGNVIGISVIIEDVKDLKVIAETILKTGGVPDKIETKTETTVTGDISVKTETIDPAMAAEVGKLLALKASEQTETEE